MPDNRDHASRRREEMAALLDEHRGRVALLPAQVDAHSLMPTHVIQQAEQQNLQRALGLKESCARYAADVRVLRDRHLREEAEERGCGLRESNDPPVVLSPAPEPELRSIERE